MKRLEHSLQIAVAHMLQVVLDPDKTWWTSIDHGVGKLGVVEAVNRKKRGVRAGLPDIILMIKIMRLGTRPMLPIIIGIELKSAKGAATEAQRTVAIAWRAMGHSYELARSLEDVHDILVRNNVPMLRRMVTFFKGGGNERPERPAKTWHQRPKRRRKSKGHLSVVLARKAQA